MTNLHRLIRHCILLLFIITNCSTASAQQKLLSDSIQALLKEAHNYITPLHNPRIAYEKIQEAERLSKKTKDSVDLLRIYRTKALLCHFNSDLENCKKNVSKVKSLLPYCNDPLEIANTYELLFQLQPLPSEKGKDYLLKAYNLFTQYGKPENKIDINYNLALLYNRSKEWDKAVKHAQLGIDAIESSQQKTGMRKYLYLYLLEAYTALGHYPDAENMLTKLDSLLQQTNKTNASAFEYLYYKKAVHFYYKTQQYKKAADLNVAAFASIDSIREREVKRMKEAKEVEHQLKVEKEELKHIQIENKLKQAQIKNGIIFIIFIVSLLIFVSVIAIYQKRNAQKMARLNKVLEKQNEDLEIISAKLKDALKAKTEFLNVMTHELFTPINGIAILTHNLKTETDKQCFNQNLDLLEFSSNYLYRLLKNVVDTKSIDKKDLVLNRDAVHLKSLLKTVAQTANIFLKTSTNTFRYHIDSDIPDPLLIDSVKLSQILINLLNNANKFTTNGNITLDVKLESETDTKTKILFKVTDSGIGIDAQFLSNIFEKFEFGSKEIKEKYGGSGIGLYVVKHFLLLHDSQITVSSEKGKGTTFSFAIWFDKVHRSTAKDLSTGGTAGSILLVDDNKVNLLVTKQLLESCNYKCDTAENGWDAIKILKDHQYDLILMDIMMPGINGFETTQKIKQANVQTPVVALTAVDIERNRDDFERTEFEAIISKPFDLEDFLKVVKTAIANGR